MLDPSVAARLRETLISIGGGYLRNPVRMRGITCTDCVTPVDGYRLCYPCKGHHAYNGLADATAFLTYAVAGEKSGYVMRGYKAKSPVGEHRMVVGLLLLLGLHGHTGCVGRLVGNSVTHWAIVPSLPAKPGEHPLRSLAKGHAGGSEIVLVATASPARPREINPTHFMSAVQLPQLSHVLLIDDTWASGGHAQSAVLALRKAGADKVSVLVVARWLKGDFAGNKEFVRQLATQSYDPGVCPWTGGTCQ